MRPLALLLTIVAALYAQQFFLFDGGQGVTFSTTDFEIVAGEFRLLQPNQTCRVVTSICSPATTPCTNGPHTLPSVENLRVEVNGVNVYEVVDYDLAGSDLTYTGFTLGAADALYTETLQPC